MRMKKLMLTGLIGFGLMNSTTIQGGTNYLNALGHTLCAAVIACNAYISYSKFKQYSTQNNQTEAYEKADRELGTLKTSMDGLNRESTLQDVEKVNVTLDKFKADHAQYAKESNSFSRVLESWKCALCSYGLHPQCSPRNVDAKTQKDLNDHYTGMARNSVGKAGIQTKRDIKYFRAEQRSLLFSARLFAVNTAAAIASYYLSYRLIPIFSK